jgi:hypothetical protein
MFRSFLDHHQGVYICASLKLVSLKYQLKYFVKIAVVQLQWKFQFVVCALGAVRRVTVVFNK